MLVDMDITRSHSRPHTSSDNPFSEAQFKSMKYTSDYPERLASVNEARTWMEGFTAYYNHEHRHSGIGCHTAASVHYGTAEAVREQRQHTLDRAYGAHPERFAHRPAAPPLPLKAAINDPAKRAEPSVH